MKKIVPVTTSRIQKETINTFDSHIIQPFFFFQGYCLYLTKKEITKMCRVQKRDSPVWSEGTERKKVKSV